MLSAEDAFRRLRVRCGHCGLGFCTRCRASPYHVGLTCEEHSSGGGEDLECRYCAKSIPKPSLLVLQFLPVPASGESLARTAARQSRVLEDLVVCSFDGVSQFVDVPTLRSVTYEETFEHYGMTAVTVEAWIRPASTMHAFSREMRSGYAIILAYGGDDYCPGFSLLLERTSRSSSKFNLVAQLSTTTTTSTAAAGTSPTPAPTNPSEARMSVETVQAVELDAVDADRWTHVAMTWSTHQGEVRLYKDGQRIADLQKRQHGDVSSTRSLRKPLQPWSKLHEFGVHLTIGGGWSQQHFNGQMAEVRVWAQSRTDWQIQRDMCVSCYCSSAALLLAGC
jgi:hypothetical protein